MTYVAKRFYLEPIGLAVLFRSYLDAVEKGIPSLIEAEVERLREQRNKADEFAAKKKAEAEAEEIEKRGWNGGCAEPRRTYHLHIPIAHPSRQRMILGLNNAATLRGSFTSVARRSPVGCRTCASPAPWKASG